MSDKRIALVSKHDKGFWQVDVWEDVQLMDDGCAPDWFCTGKIGDNRYSVISQASKAFPSIKFERGYKQ